MIAYFKVSLDDIFDGLNWDCNFILFFEVGSEMHCKSKALVGLKLFLFRLERKFISVFLWYLDSVGDFSL